MPPKARGGGESAVALMPPTGAVAEDAATATGGSASVGTAPPAPPPPSSSSSNPRESSLSRDPRPGATLSSAAAGAGNAAAAADESGLQKADPAVDVPRVTLLTRLAAGVFFIVIGGLTIANLALQLPALVTSYQNGSSQTVVQRARFRAQEVQSEAYLMLLAADNGTSSACQEAASVAQAPPPYAIAANMNTSMLFVTILYDALLHGNATLNLTRPLTSPSIARVYALIDPAYAAMRAAVASIVGEMVATNATAITPTIEGNLSTILTAQPYFLSGLVNVTREMIELSQTELQTITAREIAINVTTLVCLVLLGVLVYIPMERRIG